MKHLESSKINMNMLYSKKIRSLIRYNNEISFCKSRIFYNKREGGKQNGAIIIYLLKHRAR